MSEAITADRLKSHPMMGTWSIEGMTEEYSGFLFLEDDNLNLTLYLTISGKTPYEVLARTDPRLIPFAPPNQPTLHGRTKAGHVTLFNCAQLNYQSSTRLAPPEARVELVLRPTQAWVGGGFVSAQQPYRELSFHVPGLHNILSTIHVDHQFLVESKPRRKSPTHNLKKLTGAQQAFLVHQLRQPSVEIVRGERSYRVTLASSISQSSSSTEGIVIKTSDFVSIQSKAASLAEFMNMGVEVEQFLCLLCIGPVRGEHITVQIDDHRSAELLWSLGRSIERMTFTLMPHQMLAPLGRYPDLAQQALKKWFDATAATRLARWLIVEGLFTKESSTARFLSVAQAWEIVGREESKTAPYDKRKFKKVCREIDRIIKLELGQDAAKRLLNLLRSSNREGFSKLIQNMTDKVPELALNEICRDVSAFISSAVGVRNVLTHMQGTKKMSIGVASYLSLFLTYKLLVLFCIHACVAMRLPLDNLGMMLANNPTARAARRPLPVI